MKKTIIALLALGSVAMGYTLTDPQTIIIGQADTTNPWSYGTYATHSNGANSAPIVGGTLTDGVSYSMTQSGGKTWICPVLDNWTNQAALDAYNKEFGYTLTATQINGATLSASAGGGSSETFTLNFGGAGSAYKAGDLIAIYAFVGANHSGNASPTLTGFTVTGLADGYTTQVASSTGNGFDGLYSEGTNGTNGVDLTLVRIEGQLTDDLTVTLKGNGNKTGFTAVSYATIPEPTTATLSLLALAGLAARRRRK